MLLAAAGANFLCDCALGETSATVIERCSRHTLLGDADGEWPEERVEEPEGLREVSPGCDDIARA
jgi:hypothetical protein